MTTTTNDQLISTERLAERLDVPLGTIYRWNHYGIGPRGIRVGRHVRYRPEDVESWLDSQATTR
jgi:excisionase family DNA binding protein